MSKEYFSQFDDSIDCDPADCNRNFETSQDFDGYGVDIQPDADQAGDTPDFGSSDNGMNDLSGLYVTEDDEPSTSETQYTGIPGYPETGAPTEKTFTHGGNCVDPSDETAATNDELYTTTSAQERCSLDDYEIISDVLGSEKQLVKLYSSALCESAEEPLRDVIRANLVECAKDQYATFEFMEKRGMYSVKQADQKEILQAKQQFGPLCNCNTECGCDNTSENCGCNYSSQASRNSKCGWDQSDNECGWDHNDSDCSDGSCDIE